MYCSMRVGSLVRVPGPRNHFRRISFQCGAEARCAPDPRGDLHLSDADGRPRLNGASHAENLAAVTAVDDYTVKFSL